MIVSSNVMCLLNTSCVLEIEQFWMSPKLLGIHFFIQQDQFLITSLISVQTKPANFRQRISAADEAVV